MRAEWMLGISHSFEGSQAEAQLHFERGFSLATDQVGIRPNYFGYDHHVRALLAFSVRFGCVVSRTERSMLRGRPSTKPF